MRPADISRRNALLGGLSLGGLFLSACASQRNAGLPGPSYDFNSGVTNSPAIARAQPTYSAPTVTQPPLPRREIEIPNGIVSRSQWTRSGIARPTTNPMGPISRITIHHDATPSTDLRSSSDVARRIESIRGAHVKRGWADIGYHYIVDPAGRVWEGRSVTLQGAHVEDNNEHNLGVMVLGNFDVHSPTPTALAALDRFVASRMHVYRIPMGRVYTHREIRPTRCPGDRLQRYVTTTRTPGGGMYSLGA